MSNSVVPAAAVAHAKQLVRNKKFTSKKVNLQLASDDQAQANREPEDAQAVQAKQPEHLQVSLSDVSLSGDFTFASALSDAAASTAGLVSETSYRDTASDGGDDDGDGSGTILLIGAIALVGLGVAVLAGGGNKNAIPTVSAATQAITTNEDTAANVTVSATDSNNDPLTFSVTTAPTKGAVTGGTGGAFVYTPTANANGTDSFVVTVNDGKGGTVTQTVNVTITAVNDAPVYSATSATTLTTNEDTVGTATVTATDVDSTTLTYAVATQGTKGTTTISSAGAITYTPNANANGADTVTVSVSDGTATVTRAIAVTVTPVNDAPAAAATQSVATDEDTAVNVSVGATDIDADTLTYSVSTAPTKGALSGGANGQYTYTPNANANGADSFVILVDDGKGGTVSQTVNVAIAAVNDVPVINTTLTTSALTVAEDASGTIVVVASDADGDTLTLTRVTGPTNGSVTSGLVYSPNANFNGTDSITYRVSDGKGGTTDLVIPITVTAVNDAPVFSGSTALNSTGGTALNFTATATDIDVPAQTITYAIVTGPANGTLTAGAGGAFSYTGSSTFAGTDTFTVSASDGTATTNQTYSVTVAAAVRTVSIDVVGPNVNTPAGLTAATDEKVIFTDNANAETNVIITGFNSDDKITVTNADVTDYRFGTGTGAGENDLTIAYQTSTGVSNSITIEDVVLPGAFITGDYASAVVGLGYDFMTFG